MHPTSRLKMEAFLTVFASDSKGKTVLDVGARSVREGGYTYRQSTNKKGLVYTGLDMEAGHNVDIVPATPYIWSEIADEQFDFVISGQAFEHNPFMWITFCEIARVLKQGGRAFIIAPSAGTVHRFPFDCWRYYPDSWAALCSLAGLDMTESLREPKLSHEIQGSQWVDAAVLATKPVFGSKDMKDGFYRNLAEITAPFKARRYDVQPAKVNEGACFKEYMELVKQRTGGPQAVRSKPTTSEKQPLSPPLPLKRAAPMAELRARKAAQAAQAAQAARAAQAAQAARPANPAPRITHSVRRINKIAQLMGARSYLEIGVSRGFTFNALDFPRKVAVDPEFRFNPKEFRRPGVDFFEATSDTYFESLSGTEKFDVIFIDGLHVFQQAYRDFCNSIKHAHDRTVWLIDDVVPVDEFSALPDRRETQQRRREAGIHSNAWHGDVYKVIFAIHDLQPNYSFVTVNTGGNPQTIVWKAPRQNVVAEFGSVETIEPVDFAGFLKRQNLMNLHPEDEALQILQASIRREGRAA